MKQHFLQDFIIIIIIHTHTVIMMDGYKSLPAAADSLQHPDPRPHQQDDLCPHSERQQQQECRRRRGHRQRGSGGQDVQRGLLFAQRVGGAAGVLLSGLHVPQLADAVILSCGALSQRADRRTLQQVVRAEPLDVRQRRALNPTQSSVTGLLAALHRQRQDLWRSCSTDRKDNAQNTRRRSRELFYLNRMLMRSVMRQEDQCWYQFTSFHKKTLASKTVETQ